MATGRHISRQQEKAGLSPFGTLFCFKIFFRSTIRKRQSVEKLISHNSSPGKLLGAAVGKDPARLLSCVLHTLKQPSPASSNGIDDPVALVFTFNQAGLLEAGEMVGKF